MASIPCDVVILPSSALANKAVEASEELRQFGGLFTLKDGEYYPHSSLYMLQLNEKDLDKVKEVLAKIAVSTNELSLVATGYCQKEGFIDIEYETSEQLKRLQNDVITALNPIRDGMREKDKARMLEATGLALQNFEKYGYKYVGELFRPHITFTRFSELQSEAENVLPSPSDFSGGFPKIGLFEMGDNGTCIRKIAEFDLQ